MLIRLAVREDLPALMAMVGRVVPLMRAAGNTQWDVDYPSRDVFERDVALRQLWIAEVDKPDDGVRIVGVAAITEDQEPEYAQADWNVEEEAVVVHRLAVDPELRGAGIATALMGKAEEIAAERGIAVMRVDTSTENAATQRLFPKLGYRPAGEIGLGFRPGLRVLCYQKRLRVK